jgi:hypothetical protein
MIASMEVLYSFYNDSLGRPIWAELSPVTDFGEACCRQYETTECVRGGFCNFMVSLNLFTHLSSMSRVSPEDYANNYTKVKDYPFEC